MRLATIVCVLKEDDFQWSEVKHGGGFSFSSPCLYWLPPLSVFLALV